MNAATLRRLMTSITNLERRAVRYRQAVVTDTDPLSVAVGGASIPYVGVQAIAGVPGLAIGQAVAVLAWGKDLLVLGSLGATTVTALPADPFPGQTVSFQTSAMATDGVRWRFEYNAGTDCWEYVGGPWWSKRIAGQSTRNSNTYGDLVSGIVGPSVTPPLTGDYHVDMSAYGDGGGNGYGSFISYSIGATAASSTDEMAQYHYGGPGSTDDVKNTTYLPNEKSLTAGATLTMKYRSNGPSLFTVEKRLIRIQPISVPA